jgi:CheY-like chemotaxis protein
MTKPLALLFYEQLLPGSQLINRLQDLGYRVQVVQEAELLAETAEREKPMVIVSDLRVRRGDILKCIGALKSGAETSHIPVLGFHSDLSESFLETAKQAGVALVSGDAFIQDQLPQALESVLHLD